ncbi:MAG: GTPase Era [Clostridia bacterium]|nr:GTPase Era [Clostridia bacterium]
MENNFKSGYVGIVGKPNVGKSTILNKLVGQKIAIISPKPQTTRNKILGILHGEGYQAVFLDTPGFHKPRTKLGENMVKAVNEAIGDVDLIMLVVEPNTEIAPAEQAIIDKLGDIPAILVINKTDTVKRDELLNVIALYSQKYNFCDIVPVSARTGENLDELKSVINQNLTEGPMYYPEDMVTDQQEKEIVAELIREKMLKCLRDEIPHGTAVEIVKMKYTKSDKGDMYNISANIFCEKNSHKGIIIGKGGKTLKDIGTAARIDCEKMLDAKVYLELWVKVKEDWRNSNNLMKELGIIEQS